jgi:hypothetical protein
LDWFVAPLAHRHDHAPEDANRTDECSATGCGGSRVFQRTANAVNGILDDWKS